MKQEIIKHSKEELFEIFKSNNFNEVHFIDFYIYYLETFIELSKHCEDILEEDDDTYQIVILRYSINYITKTINYINYGHSKDFASKLSSSTSELRDDVIDCFNVLINKKKYDIERESNAIINYLFEDEYHRKYLKIYFNEYKTIPYFFENIIESYKEYHEESKIAKKEHKDFDNLEDSNFNEYDEDKIIDIKFPNRNDRAEED
jgi:hypothetical protein